MQRKLIAVDWGTSSLRGALINSEGVVLAGEPERKARADREQNGIWIDDATWSEIQAAEAKLK